MTKLKEILQLSVEKRIHLIQTIWDSIAEEALNADLSEEHKAILKDRYESYQSNPDDNVSWEEVKKENPGQTMTFQVEFRREALQDVEEIVDWYEDKLPGLGDEFFISLTEVVYILQKTPEIYNPQFREVRKAITRKFPYLVCFKIDKPDKVIIFGVLQMKREPKNWKGRI